MNIRNSDKPRIASQPDNTPGTSGYARKPIKFIFVPSIYGFSTRGESYYNYDGDYGARCHWSDLKLVDRRVQSGTFNTIDVARQPRGWRPEISFPMGFGEDPVVVVWLTGIDVRCERPCQVSLRAVNVTKTGFQVFITQSEDKVWDSLGFSWVAWPGADSRYSCSSFETVLYGISSDPLARQLKFHKLPNGAGTNRKTVLAVRGLTMGCGGTMPFLLEQVHVASGNTIVYDVTAAMDATAMYILDVVCITCV